MFELSSEIESDLEVMENRSSLQVEIVLDPHAEARYLDNLHKACTRRIDHFFRLDAPLLAEIRLQRSTAVRTSEAFYSLHAENVSERRSAMAYTGSLEKWLH